MEEAHKRNLSLKEYLRLLVINSQISFTNQTSIREAEITNRLVKAILIPRNKLDEAAKRDIANFTGVYFLFGSSDETTKQKVYLWFKLKKPLKIEA